MNDTRRFGRNFGTIAFAQLVSQVLTLIISVVLARSLGVEQYGVFVFALAFPSWFLLLTSLGMDAVLTIDVAADRSKARSYLTALVVLRIPLVLATLAFLWLFVQLTLADPVARIITMILGTTSILTTYAGTFRSVFQAFERLEYGALVTIVERLITTAGVLVLLFSGYGLLEVSLVFLFGSVVSLGLLIVITRTRFVWLERRVDRATVTHILRRTIPFALAVVASTFLYTSGPVLLTILRDPSATGEFNAAFALTIALLSPLPLYATAILPVLSRLHREQPGLLPAVMQRAQKLFFLVGMPVALGGWFYATEIITLFYGPAFETSAQSFQILVFTVAVTTAVAGNGPALLATRHQNLSLFIGITSAATNVGLCLGLIPLWGPVGAAYAFLAARLVGGSLRMIALNRLVARIDLRVTLARPILASLAMIVVLYLLPGLPLWLGILGGGSVYFLLLFAMGGIVKEDLALVQDALRGAFFR